MTMSETEEWAVRDEQDHQAATRVPTPASPSPATLIHMAHLYRLVHCGVREVEMAGMDRLRIMIKRSLESGNETGTEIVTVTATVSVNVIMRDGIGKETMIGEIEIEKGRGRGRGDAILRHRLRRLRDRVRGVTPGIGHRRRRRRGAAGRSI